MALKRTELTARIPAIDEKSGKRYEILKYTKINDTQTFGNPGAETRGLEFFRLADDSPIRMINDDEFEIEGSGLILRRIKP